MNKKGNISIQAYKNAFAEVPESYFQLLETRILDKTIHKAALKQKLSVVLHAKPEGFETFQSQEGYFDTLEQALVSQTVGDVNRMPLFDLKHDLPFNVPEGYFEGLSSQIRKKIPARKELRPWEWLPGLVKQPVYLIAASICFLAMIGLGYFQISKPATTTNWTASIETLNHEELSDYLVSQSDEIDLQNLPAAYMEAEFSKTQWNEMEVNDLILADEL